MNVRFELRGLIAAIVLCAICGCTRDGAVPKDPSQGKIRATVVACEIGVQWDHFEDGSFAAYDQITLRIDSSQKQKKPIVRVIVGSNELPANSPYRSVGTRLTFSFDGDLPTEDKIYWGALEDRQLLE